VISCVWNWVNSSLNLIPASRTPKSNSLSVMRPLLFRVWVLGTLVALHTSFSHRLSSATVTGSVVVGQEERRQSALRYARGIGETPGPPPPMVAVVYLTADKLDETSMLTDVIADNAPLEIAQRNVQFDRYVLPVRVGQSVVFPNHDPIYHNVFSYSDAKSFDLGRYHESEQPGEVTFDEPGLVSIHCEIHRHMRTYVLVLNTPYFTTTQPDGSFTLQNVPTGSYTLTVWTGPNREVSQPVTVRQGQATQVTIE
jgi:plastocyanin